MGCIHGGIAALDAFLRLAGGSVARLLAVVHAGRLLQTFPAEFAPPQKAAVKLHGDGFAGLLAPGALRRFVVPRNQSLHCLGLSRFDEVMAARSGRCGLDL